jgi:chorismate synthase
MSIPAIKAVGIGMGPRVADLPGSQVHDEIVLPEPEPEPVHVEAEAAALAATVSAAARGGVALAGDAATAATAAQPPQSHAHRRDLGVVRPTNNAGGLEGGITNGEPLRITAYMKPISTLMKPLRSVDLATMEESPAAIERSDVCAVPAAGVIAEAMVCLILADAFMEKFGGDSIAEMARHYAQQRERVRARFAEQR